MKLTPNVEMVEMRKRGKVFGTCCAHMLRHDLATIKQLAEMADCSEREIRKAIKRATAQ